MFALPGIALLLLLVYVRPQEFVPLLRAVPLLYLAAALAAAGLLVDLRVGRSRLRGAPQLPWVLGFALLCAVSLAVRAPQDAGRMVLPLAVSLGLFAIVAHGVQTFRAIEVVGGLVLALVLLLAAVGVHQKLAPLGCLAIDERGGSADERGGSAGERGAPVAGDLSGLADGRPCESRLDCETPDAEPGADYLCEHVGLLGTSSIGGRVRFRGHLNDPNELALAACIGLPFAFVSFDRRRTAARAALGLGALALVGACTIYTQSRGGVLVFLAVLGVWLVRRLPRAGLVLAALAALPIALLGGRGGDEAAASAHTRTDAWYEGLQMLEQYPLLGVGPGQFIDHHVQTAHNAYLLAAAEVGLPGLLAWSGILYVSLKTLVVALGQLPPEQRAARALASSLLASLVGLCVGILFLSFTFHPVLWIHVGLAGAFALALQRHQPGFRVRFGGRDLALLVGIDAALLGLVLAWTHLHLS